MLGPDLWDGSPQPNDLKCLSASTVKEAMARPTLEKWSIWETARRTVAELPMLVELAETQPALAERWIADSRWSGQRSQLSSADGGTLIHLVAEHWLRGEPAPEVPQYLWPEMAQLQAWFQAHRPTLHAAELAVFHETHQVGGRFDAMAWINGKLWLIDFKCHPTSSGWDRRGKAKPCYVDSNGIQLSVYANATHYMTWEPRVCTAANGKGRLYLVSPEEYAQAEPMPKIDGALVVDIWSDRCSMSEIDVSEAVFQRALAARDLWYWLNVEATPVTPTWQHDGRTQQ
mgnify:CR=1 FL=1